MLNKMTIYQDFKSRIQCNGPRCACHPHTFASQLLYAIICTNDFRKFVFSLAAPDIVRIPRAE